MKRTLSLLVIVAAALVGAAQFASAQRTASVETKTGIATLFARDPLTQSVCFRDGGPGAVFQDGQARNRCSDLNFNSYASNSFRVGVEGDREGVILDLGTPEELKARYGFTETVTSGQGFASLDVKNGKVLISKDYRTGALQELTGTGALFGKPSQELSSAPVKIGHIYLARTTSGHDKAFEMLVKILVLSYVPGESVTIRWHLL